MSGDKELVERYVEPAVLKRWKAYVMGTEDGIDKSPRWAEGICGVPAETIEEFARLYARSKPANLNVSAGIGRQFYGENPTRAAMYLQALTGNTCIPGGTPAAETGMFIGRPVGPRPEVDWQRKPGIYTAPVLMIAYKWPKAIDLHMVPLFSRVTRLGTKRRNVICALTVSRVVKNQYAFWPALVELLILDAWMLLW